MELRSKKYPRSTNESEIEIPKERPKNYRQLTLQAITDAKLYVPLVTL